MQKNSILKKHKKCGNHKARSTYLTMPPARLFEVEKPVSAEAFEKPAFAACPDARNLADVADLVAAAIVLVVIAFETSSVTAVVFDFGLGRSATDWTSSAGVIVELDLATNLTCSAEIASV